jgi:hypothetical protein
MHRLACAAAGEQPTRVTVGGGVHVRPLVDPLKQQGGDRAGDRGRWFAQAQQDLVSIADHVVGGEADDTAERLRVEQDDRRGDSGTQGLIVFGQHAADEVDSLGLRQWCRRGNHHSGESEAASELVGHAPRQEWAQGEAGVGTVSDDPCVDVGLAARPRGEVAFGEPPEELRRVVDLGAEASAAGAGQRFALRSGS